MNEEPRRHGSLLMMAGLVDYGAAWILQQRLHAERVADQRPDTLILLEHTAVYTIGRRTLPDHLPYGETGLRATGAYVTVTNRGGSVTYHGPGQLVGYSILRLSDSASGPREYVWLLEEVLRRTLAGWGITARRVSKTPGLFIDVEGCPAKLASIGVRVERGVTLHGFALNVHLDMAPFSYIVPCGLNQYKPTSMAALRGSSVAVELVARQVAEKFADIFDLAWEVGVPALGMDLTKEHSHHA